MYLLEFSLSIYLSFLSCDMVVLYACDCSCVHIHVCVVCVQTYMCVREKEQRKPVRVTTVREIIDYPTRETGYSLAPHSEGI